jgi:HEAT repeat protein
LIEEQELQNEDNTPAAAARRKFPWAMIVVVALFVIVPFFSWYGTWFGRTLSESKIEEYLGDQTKPRNAQHALSQIANQIMSGDQSVKKFYPAVTAASRHASPEVRLTAAWVMGQDNSYEEFHSVLRSLLEDPHPGVRHNAALSLVRFGDVAGKAELIRMLQPATLRSETEGTVELILHDEGAAVAAHAPVARIKNGNQTVELRAPEESRIGSLSVADGAKIGAGDDVMVLLPSADQVWEALRALYLVGQPEDAAAVESYTRPLPGMGDHIQKQAAATLEAIRARK